MSADLVPHTLGRKPLHSGGSPGTSPEYVAEGPKSNQDLVFYPPIGTATSSSTWRGPSRPTPGRSASSTTTRPGVWRTTEA